MSQHYRPMLAHPAEAPFNSRDWIFEVKWDGIRAISYVNKELSLRSRNNRELRYNFPELEELEDLVKNVVLDGEIVVMKNGKADFQTLLERTRTSSANDVEYKAQRSPATYVVFDILEKEGKPLINLSLRDRKRILKEHVKEGKHVVLSLYAEEEGIVYYDAALKMGVEGIMAKKKNSPYQPGVRSNNWLKIKRVLSCDCVIFGYTTGEGRRASTFGALILGLYNKGRPVYVGKVGTGFSQNDAELFIEMFQRIRTQEKTLEAVDAPEKITWLKPELVCEVNYQTATRDGKLRIPRFRVLRLDKTPSECTLDQIERQSLQEYISKRDFSATPEPKSAETEAAGKRFVVQEHHARTLHYDLRLEKDGVLKSWAVPKGLPERAGTRRLAVETEDHPLEYRNFEGTIPKGQYGAGTVKMWDNGRYDPKIWEENKIEFTLHGKKLSGVYILAKFRKAKGNDWLLLKAKD